MHRPKAPYVSNKHRMQTKSTGTHLSWDLLDEASRMFFKFRSSQEVESVLLFLDLASAFKEMASKRHHLFEEAQTGPKP